MVTTQLFIGREQSRGLSPDSLQRRILESCRAMGAERLMIWNAADDEWAAVAADAAEEAGAEPWLWYPVFADNPVLKEIDAQICVPSCDLSLLDAHGAWSGSGPDEDFIFFCPNQASTVAALREELLRRLDQCSWRGVFLDRMRYPSPANGVEALATCFCDTCRERMEAAGISVSAVQAALALLPERLKAGQGARYSGTPMDVHTALLEDLELSDWESFRCRSLEAALDPLIEASRSRGLGVGLDLYSPSLSILVSQDYHSLGARADWIKPMTYYRAPGPAGFPVEWECLAKGMVERESELSDSAARELATTVTGFRPGIENGQIGELIVKELILGETLLNNSSLPLVPGVELVHIPELGIDTTPETVTEILAPVRKHTQDISVSWSILLIPLDVARAVGELYA